MQEILTVKDVMEQYGLTRYKTEQLLALCREVPRVPRGKRGVLRSELERIMRMQK